MLIVNERSPLSLVAGTNNFKLLKSLVEHGANVNIRDGWGHTPLFPAIEIFNIDTVKYLVEHGADVNAQDNVKRTSLHTTAQSFDDIAIAQYLIEKGADVNLKDNWGYTPLGLVSSYSFGDAMHFLLTQVGEEAEKRVFENLARALKSI